MEFGQDFHGLEELIASRWKTMHNVPGGGLAALQIGKVIRLFIVDNKSTYENLNPEEREI